MTLFNQHSGRIAGCTALAQPVGFKPAGCTSYQDHHLRAALTNKAVLNISY